MRRLVPILTCVATSIGTLYSQSVPPLPSQPVHIAAPPIALRQASPRLDPNHKYSLAELIDFAESHNPETRTAWELAKQRAAELGIAAGDRIVSINDNPLLDAIDFQFNAQSEKVSFEVERQGIIVRHDLDLEGDEFWGITFGDPTFDGVRICENACPFCFIKQIPKGMRKSLYVMDDDFRYSMLYGAFVTLTNLDEADWQRIEREKISPMHVSVHATNPELRVALVGNPKGAQILDDLGLEAALRWLARSFHDDHRIAVGLDLDEPFPAIDGDLSTLIFRVTQESLSNVAKHANAGHVEIALKQRSFLLTLAIRDDGRGCDPAAALEKSARGGSSSEIT